MKKKAELFFLKLLYKTMNNEDNKWYNEKVDPEEKASRKKYKKRLM
ncbi:MAG: hypothetical protein IIB95_06295 [Candidatus Marinimicrobia bacterium]|nr:hypothetical protein [Candidatus Neomarinimicrobiota bacterium]